MRAVCLMCALASVPIVCAGQTPGWFAEGGSWVKRKQITIEGKRITGTLAGFPLLFSTTDPDLRHVGKGGFVASLGGQHIAFTAGDGVTRLRHEIERYDPASGTLMAWVRVPLLSAGVNTVLYIYFGNTAGGPATEPAGVWDAGFAGVYHLSDPVGTELRDSAAATAHLARGAGGGPAPVTAGKIAGAQRFGEGHADFAVRAGAGSSSANATLSLWIKRAEPYTRDQRSGYVARSGSGTGDLEFRSTPANSLAVSIDGSPRTIAADVGDGWNHIALARGKDALKVYVNGRLAQTIALDQRSALGFLGLGNSGGAGSFAGWVDEVRWSATERPAEWIAAEYVNQNEPELFLTVGPLEPVEAAQDGAVRLYRKSGVAVGAVEDVTRRSPDARHFRNADGSWTAVLGRNQNTELWQTANGWELRGGEVGLKAARTAAGHDLEYRFSAKDGSARSVALGFPALAYRQRSEFAFSLGGQEWRLEMDAGRSHFATLVTAPKGVQTYTFPLDAKGANLAINARGDAVSEDGFVVTRALVYRADGKVEQCGAWRSEAAALSFTCDDSAFPASAYPYAIDPALAPPVANLQSCRTCSSGLGGCVNGCTAGSYLSENQDDAYGYFHTTATWTMDTSSIPTSATVTSVAASLTPGWSGSYTYTVTGNGVAMGSCSPGQTCNVSAPAGSIVKGGVTTFTGDCGTCGGWYDWETGSFGYGGGMLSSFGLTVNYQYAPTSITVTTSPAGRTMVVDGVTLTSPQTFQWVVDSKHTIAIANTTQNGNPGTRYVWTHWNDSGQAAHEITVPVSAATYTAHFTTQHELTTQAPGVGGTIAPATGWRDSGSVAQVQATPNPNYVFDRFSGALTGSANPQALTLTGPATVTANFTFMPVGYGYYYQDGLSSIIAANWNQNGTLAAGAGGLTSGTANGGSLISTAPIPPQSGGSYEVKTAMTLTQSGGTYVTYLRASADALGEQGTYIAVEVDEPTFAGGACTAVLRVRMRTGGTPPPIDPVTAPCRNGMVVRSVFLDNTPPTEDRVAVWVDDVLYLSPEVGQFASGMPGVGVRGAPAGNRIQQVQLGPLDANPPNAVAAGTLKVSAAADRVDLQWAAPAQSGVGVGRYEVLRNGAHLLYTSTPSATDITVDPNTTYTYTIKAVSFHLQTAETPVTVVTPAAPVYSLRSGIRGTGAYWGGMGENIDVLSGNLNFTLPLLKAQGRGGWGVGFSLSYNSQTWKYDGGVSWKLGRDVGYGHGWRLLAGAVAPQYGPDGALAGYQWMDASGAAYRLDVNTGGVWTSRETYVTYDSGTNRLYFNDGSFWVMGCVSSKDEGDAGTRYPTLMQDTNGNQVKVRYLAGLGSAAADTSARIAEIEDVRAVGYGILPPYGYRTYLFTYANGHLHSISNSIGTSEGYEFAYDPADPDDPAQEIKIRSPFDQSEGYGNLVRLKEVRIAGLTLKHVLDADLSGQLTKVRFPYEGYLKWEYGVWNYAGGRRQMEVVSRWASKDGLAGSEKRYDFAHDDPNDGTRAAHASTKLDDPGLIEGRTWVFGATGLLTELKRREHGQTAALASDTFTWAQDTAGRWYIGTTVSSVGAVSRKTEQALDGYGNVLWTKLYDWNALDLPKRTYTNAYVTGSEYLSRYIRNRLVTSVASGGGTSVTLVSNTFDATAISAIAGEVRQHDASYGTAFAYRGNVTGVTSPGTVASLGYDIGGNRVTSTVNGVTATSGYQQGTNWAAPGSLTANGLTSDMEWSGFLGLTQNSGPNGEASGTVFDSFARPQTSTAATGAVTTYAYALDAPWTVTATVNGRWTRKTLDGFGRVVKAEAGHGGTTVSVVETEYDACACSATGKVKRVSMPRAPAGSAEWTGYLYDALGRTLRVTAPDNSFKEYEYADNTVKVYDEARKWKKYWMDGLGNLVKVEEPKPAADTMQAGNYITTYSYDLLNHLTGVEMTRGDGGNAVTQTRTFNYGTPPGAYLLSATNPESGTVTYAYNTDGTLGSKVDAKGQKTEYGYDTSKRLNQVRRYPSVGALEDESARVDLSYDTNPYEAGYSAYSAGRLTARRYVVNGVTFTEMYSYTRPGQVAKKKVVVGKYGATAALEGQWEYNAEGQMRQVTYPAAVGGGGQTYVYGYDAMGRLKTMGAPESQTNVVSDVTYGPAGELLTMTGVVNETRTYNTRLQLTGLNGVTFGYGTTNNNGRIATETDTVSGETVVYQYDELNRLMKAETELAGGWGQQFSYDGFGNLTSKSGTPNHAPAPTMTVAVNRATNRVGGYTYDANGNQLGTNTQTLSYDYENRISVVDNRNSTGRAYGYDPDNRRVYEAQWCNGSRSSPLKVSL